MLVKPEGKTPGERPRMGWMNCVEKDLRVWLTGKQRYKNEMAGESF
jgi:hypothetical protein